MRSRILTALCTLSLSGPLAASLPAHAQDAEGEEQQEGGETQGGDIVDMPSAEGPQTPAGTAGRESAPGTTHTVEKGDTLWDLSQRYLGSPWYWPKVWSYNPEIANPHWIYPGNQVKFFAGGEEAPARVDIGGNLDEGLEAPQMESDNGFSVAGKIGYTPNTTARIVHDGFVTEKELTESGKIASSFSEANMLTVFDTVYVKFKNKSDAKLGDRYVIYRTVQDVRHPVKGGRFGYLTKYLGVMRVTKVDNKLVTAEITDAYDEINREDLVGPYGEQLVENVTSRPNESTVEGVVVTGLVPYLTILGEHHDIVIDKGSADGVQQGNIFTMVRQQDLGGNFMEPAKDQDKDLPEEEIARCMAVTVKEHSTTCTLTGSIREVVPGDRARMSPEQNPSASR